MPKSTSKSNIFSYSTIGADLVVINDYFWEGESDDDTIFPLEYTEVDTGSGIWELDGNNDFTLFDSTDTGSGINDGLWEVNDDRDEVTPLSVTEMETHDPD